MMANFRINRCTFWSWVIVALMAPIAGAADAPATLLKPAPTPPSAPVPAAEAAGHMTLPEGFHATLFAGEPDVVQPIAFTFDDRGRLWVVENFSYPRWLPPEATEAHDRIVIFDDPDGTGHFHSKKVFYDKGVNISGIELGMGGVWLTCAPHLVFIPIHPGEDKPAGPPTIVLDGFSLREARHNVFNHLTWGPDGWLWGLDGILAHCHVGKPGTPDNQRTAMDCGVWRYQPTTQTFEVVASGTTNPWGLDFDDNGQPFITNCVINHLWHVIPGAHYQRMFGQDLSEDAYSLIGPCADHYHWAGGAWTSSRTGLAHSIAGGGHAHVGAMVYLGDNWPDSYRDTIFTCNLHGSRLNNDILAPKGSGYVGHHGKDFMLANDPWFRGIDVKYGPDGGVFVSDWTDTGECHNYDVVDQTNGRIYKITYGSTAARSDLATLNLATATDAELVKLQLHKNDWFVRHARRLLQERSLAGKLDAGVAPALRKILSDDSDAHHKLRALWALHAIGATDEATLLAQMNPADPWLCWWAIELAVENRNASPAVLAAFEKLASAEGASPTVRLAIASALQRLPLEARWPIAEALCGHAEDATDQNLPLMDWYGIAGSVAGDPARAIGLIRSSQISPVREFSARRLTNDQLPKLVELLGSSTDAHLQLDVLHGILGASQDQQHLAMPAQWAGAYDRLSASSEAEVRDNATALALLFGDERALAQQRATLGDSHQDTAARVSALHHLIQSNDKQLPSLLVPLLKDAALRKEALVAMGTFANDATAPAVLREYSTLNDAEKSAAVISLAARPASAAALLDAVDAGHVEKAQVSTFVVRQLASLNDPKITQRVEKIFGVVHASSKDKLERIAAYKKTYTPEVMKNADRPKGRLLFSRSCGLCHTLFDAGGTLAPNLTGSQRANMEYLLSKILDPNASVPRDYQMTIVQTKNGQVVSGIIASDTPQALTLKTPTGAVVFQAADIARRKTQPISMMPEGLLDGLNQTQTRDLLGYLMGSDQVVLPPG